MKKITIAGMKYITLYSRSLSYPKGTGIKDIKNKKNEIWKVKNVRILQTPIQKYFKLFSFSISCSLSKLGIFYIYFINKSRNFYKDKQ